MTATRPTRKRGARAEVPVTAEAIVDTAFRLIEERGHEGFSMRSLATEMGVFPATLYWHVGDRARLLGLVEARWLGGIEMPTTENWDDWARSLARNYRDHAHRHPNVARLVSVERARNPENIAIPDAVLRHLDTAGLGNEVIHAYNAILGAVQGFVVMELARVIDPSEESVAENERDLRALDPERFPAVTKHFDEMANRALSLRWSAESHRLPDESFEYMLDLLLTGIAARAEGRRR
jgi:AcrR family transcriptional regulator